MSQRIINNISAALVEKQGVDFSNINEDDHFIFFVNGGTLTYDQDTETKVSGQLDVSLAASGYNSSEDFSAYIIRTYVKIYINHNLSQTDVLININMQFPISPKY